MAELGFGTNLVVPENELEKQLLEAGVLELPVTPSKSPPLVAEDFTNFTETQLLPVDPSQFASSTSPNQEAADRSLAAQLGLEPGAIHDDSRKSLQQLGIQDTIENDTFDAPTLRAMLQADQNLTALSSGSIPALVASEKAAKELSFTGAFSNGVDLLQGLGYRFIEATGEAIGSEAVEAFGQAGAEVNIAEAAAGGVKQRFQDITTAGEFFDWMKQTAGEQIPLMAPSLVAGVAGAATGAAAGPVGALIGGVLGAFIPSFVLGVGETQNAIKERDITVEAPGAAFGSGFLIGLLDSALPGKVGSMARKAFGRELTEKAIEKIATRIMVRNAAVKGGGGMLLEGVTEVFQEVISETTAASATGQEIDQAALVDQLIEAFAAGAFIGGGVTVGVSTGGDIIHNRRFDTAMRALNNAAKDSELKVLAPDKAAEVHVAQMRAGGVETVFVPADVIINYAQNQPEGTPDVLNKLGVTEGLEAGGKVEIPLAQFTKEILGTEGFNAIAKHLSATADGTSIAESVETVFSDAQIEADLSDQLELFDADETLKETVQDTVTKAAADPANASDIIAAAGDQVSAVMDALIQGVEGRRVDTTADEEAGRLSLLDDQIAAADVEIAALDTERDARVDAEQSTVAIDKKIQAAVDARNALADEQFEINVPAQQAPMDEAAQADLDAAAAKARADSPIKIKAGKLQKLAVKITTESVRSAREGFRAAVKAGKVLAQAKKDVKKALTAAAKDTALTKTKSGKEQLSRLRERISGAETVAQLKKVTEAVQSRMAVLIEGERRKQIKKAIEVTLKKNKPKVMSGKLVGTEADVEAILKRSREIMDENVGVAAEKLEAMLARDIYSEDHTAFEQQLMAVAANDKQMTSREAEEVLLQLDAIINEGKASAANRIMREKIAVQRDQAEYTEAASAGDVIGAMKTSGFFARLKAKAQEIRTSLASMHNGWDEVLDITINKKGVDNDRLIQSLRLTKYVQKFKGRVLQWESRLQELAFEAFDLKTYSQLMDRHRADSAVIDFGVFENKNGDTVRLEYSRAQIRKIWMERQDPTIRDIVQDKDGNAFTDVMMRAMFAELGQTDYAYARAQLKLYKEMYKDINRTYRRIYGIDLPFNEFYSPIRREKDTKQTGDDTFGGDHIIANEMTFRRNLPTNIKARQEVKAGLKRTSDVGSMHRYMHDMAWFTETAEQVVHMKNVYKSQKLRKAIEAKHGKSMNRFIDEFLEDFGTGYPTRGIVAEDQVNFMNRQFSASILALKGTIGTKQLVSWFAMADGIPTLEFMASHADFFKSPAATRKIIKTLWEASPALRQRGSSLDFEMAKVGSDREPVITWKHGQKLQDVFFSMIRTGDRIPIYAGGWAVYQHTLKKTGSKKKAIEAFEDAMNSTQQSTDIDKMSGLQRSGAIGRTLTMFMTARMALLRGELRAFRQRPKGFGGTGKLSYREFGKRMALYHFAMPMMIQFIASGFKWDEDRQLIAGLLGQLNTFVIFGDLLTIAATEIVGGDARHWQGDSDIPLEAVTKELWEGAAAVFDEDLRADDMLEVIVELGGALGNFAGQPVDQVANIIGGLDDTLNGDIEQGLKRIWGFSEKVATESSE